MIRPCGVTAVASIKDKPGPRVMIPPRCARCQGVKWPLSAEYWHSGERMMRFWKVRPRRVRGWKSFGGSGERVVPAGGDWRGVKKETSGAGALTREGSGAEAFCGSARP